MPWLNRKRATARRLLLEANEWRNGLQSFDLNLRNSQLEKQALALGFTKTFTPPTIEVKTQRDLNNIHENGNGFYALESVDSELLRKAAKRARGRALVNAFLVKNFHRDDGLVRVVAESENVFEIPLYYFLHSAHVHRAKLFDETAAFLEKCLKLKALFAFSSRAESEFDLKSPREIIAVGECLGLTREQAAFALGEAPTRFLTSLRA